MISRIKMSEIYILLILTNNGIYRLLEKKKKEKNYNLFNFRVFFFFSMDQQTATKGKRSRYNAKRDMYLGRQLA